MASFIILGKKRIKYMVENKLRSVYVNIVVGTWLINNYLTLSSYLPTKSSQTCIEEPARKTLLRTILLKVLEKSYKTKYFGKVSFEKILLKKLSKSLF